MIISNDYRNVNTYAHKTIANTTQIHTAVEAKHTMKAEKPFCDFTGK